MRLIRFHNVVIHLNHSLKGVTCIWSRGPLWPMGAGTGALGYHRVWDLVAKPESSKRAIRATNRNVADGYRSNKETRPYSISLTPLPMSGYWIYEKGGQIDGLYRTPPVMTIPLLCNTYSSIVWRYFLTSWHTLKYLLDNLPQAQAQGTIPKFSYCIREWSK